MGAHACIPGTGRASLQKVWVLPVGFVVLVVLTLGMLMLILDPNVDADPTSLPSPFPTTSASPTSLTSAPTRTPTTLLAKACSTADGFEVYYDLPVGGRGSKMHVSKRNRNPKLEWSEWTNRTC